MKKKHEKILKLKNVLNIIKNMLSIFPKFFSKIITLKITPLFKSLITNLITMKHHFLTSFSNCHQTNFIYSNFEKAFDRVHHKLFKFTSQTLFYLGSIRFYHSIPIC